MNPVYCTVFDSYNASACYIRMGDILYYPVINHYGWSLTGAGRPKQCTKSRMTPGSAAYYYCSKSSPTPSFL